MTPFTVEELLVTVVPYQAACEPIRGGGQTACESPSRKFCQNLPTPRPCSPGGSQICFNPRTPVCNLPATPRPRPPAAPKPTVPPKPPAKPAKPTKKKQAPAKKPAARKKHASSFVDDFTVLQAQLRARLESGTAPA